MTSYRKARDRTPLGTSNTLQADSLELSTALRGAALAFSSQPASSDPISNAFKDTDGARIAASLADHDGRFAHNGTQECDGGVGSRQAPQQLSPPRGSTSRRESFSHRKRSPSHIAAVIASSNSSSAQHSQTSLQPPVSHRPPTSHWLIDGTSIDPTNNIFKLYDQVETPKNSTTLAKSRQVSNTTVAIISPTPIRIPSASLPLQDLEALPLPKVPMKNGGSTSSNSSRDGAFDAANNQRSRPFITRSQTSSVANGPVASAASSRRTSKPTTPAVPNKHARPLIPLEYNAGSLESSHISSSNKGNVPDNAPLRGRSQCYVEGISIKPTPEPSPKHESRLQRAPHEARRSFEKPFDRSVPQEITFSTTSLVPQLTADSLANAMVASSLASSRAPSPSKPSLPPPRRHGKPHGYFYRSHSSNDVSRTSSPTKQMRQTLRTPRQLELEEDSYRKRRSHFMKKHPNKHHEGDRKRWRDTVSEAERKRYEGIWAANKNILLPISGPSSDTVCNIVVRDTWRRSRLPDDVLEEVWELVDIKGVGALTKEEFVVGMWLIDQRLKGKKLPVKVSESVWESVRMLSGIKVPKHR